MASSSWPRSSIPTRSSTSRRLGRGRRSDRRNDSGVPFRPTFDCLWCGTAHACRGADDLEGWAQLCSACVGKAGDNGFLRFRLRQALTERGTAARGSSESVNERPTSVPAAAPDMDRDLVAYYEARAPEYDDWYRRRGRYARGPVHDAAWDAELDAAGR